MNTRADVARRPLSSSPRTTGLVSEKVAVSVVFVAAMFMSIMDTTIVNVALPTIGRDFSVSPTSVDSVSIAYLVSLAVFIPASGWLGDRFGGKRVLLTAIAGFSVASALCGLASSLGELVACLLPGRDSVGPDHSRRRRRRHHPQPPLPSPLAHSRDRPGLAPPRTQARRPSRFITPRSSRDVPGDGQAECEALCPFTVGT